MLSASFTLAITHLVHLHVHPRKGVHLRHRKPAGKQLPLSSLDGRCQTKDKVLGAPMLEQLHVQLHPTPELRPQSTSLSNRAPGSKAWKRRNRFANSQNAQPKPRASLWRSEGRNNSLFLRSHDERGLLVGLPEKLMGRAKLPPGKPTRGNQGLRTTGFLNVLLTQTEVERWEKLHLISPEEVLSACEVFDQGDDFGDINIVKLEASMKFFRHYDSANLLQERQIVNRVRDALREKGLELLEWFTLMGKGKLHGLDGGDETENGDTTLEAPTEGKEEGGEGAADRAGDEDDDSVVTKVGPGVFSRGLQWLLPLTASEERRVIKFINDTQSNPNGQGGNISSSQRRSLTLSFCSS